MLRLILGHAGVGKTSRIIKEISSFAETADSGFSYCNAQAEKLSFLVVPEQYSFEAERELCRTLGAKSSLYAEVVSFTGLCRRAAAELGGGRNPLDPGGRLLCLSRAVGEVRSGLRVFGAAAYQPGLQKALLDTISELKTAKITPDTLSEIPGNTGTDTLLRQKLSDIFLIYSAYERIIADGRLDPLDNMNRLAERISSCSFSAARFYFDGFSDFTPGEEAVVEKLLSCGAEVTVCLTLPSLSDDGDAYYHSRRQAHRLLRAAEKLGINPVTEIFSGAGGVFDAPKKNAANADLFGGGGGGLNLAADVSLRSCGDVDEECRLAAARCVELVRRTGCRWRDITVAARGFADYRPRLNRIFAEYNIPLYTAEKSDILKKPAAALIFSALDCVMSGYGYEDMFAYLKTGLAGLDFEECDILENYVIYRDIKGGVWTRAQPWTLPPDGFPGEDDEGLSARLERIDAIRRRAAEPLKFLDTRTSSAKTAGELAAAVADFIELTELPQKLAERAERLTGEGFDALAAEYRQLWEIIISALEQFADILGDTPMERAEFAKLFRLQLSGYTVGTIPVSLDSVSAGDMDRIRRRSIKHLIVLGASDGRLPAPPNEGGILSLPEKDALRALGLPVSGGVNDCVCREMNLIGNCLTLASDTLLISYPQKTADGDERPGFVMNRVAYLRGSGIRRAAAEELRIRVKTAANKSDSKVMSTGRGSLSPSSVRLLYGGGLRLSPTRLEALQGCAYRYFLKHGLGARERAAARFGAPEFGTFAHYVLEGVTRDIMSTDGGENGKSRNRFASVSDDLVGSLVEKHIASYVGDKLNGFAEKSERFIYLFRRLEASVRRMTADIAAELKNSEFFPVGFELRFGAADGLPPIIVQGKNAEAVIGGIADRVDVCIKNGKLYLRVIDYKTGKKAFSLSDIWYGSSLQLPLYLSAVAANLGKAVSLPDTLNSGSSAGISLSDIPRGVEIIPAGALYVPAFDKPISAAGNIGDEELAKLRAKKLRRSGLVLNEPEVISAMELDPSAGRLPVTYGKDGEIKGDALFEPDKLGILSKHITRTVKKLTAHLSGGDIDAKPYYRGENDNACLYCEYKSVCRFDEERDTRRYQPKLKAEEVWRRMEESENGGI